AGLTQGRQSNVLVSNGAERAIEQARARQAEALIFRLDTPGGLLTSTREGADLLHVRRKEMDDPLWPHRQLPQRERGTDGERAVEVRGQFHGPSDHFRSRAVRAALRSPRR